MATIVEAAANGHWGRIKWHIGQGCDPDETNDYGETALFFAADKNQPAIVTLLADADADLEKKYTELGYTALHVAVTAGHIDCVRALLLSGANPEATDDAGKKPLQHARQLQDSDSEAALHKASPDTAVTTPETPKQPVTQPWCAVHYQVAAERSRDPDSLPVSSSAALAHSHREAWASNRR